MNLTQLQEAIEQYYQSTNSTQNEVAKKLGISADVLISVKNNRTERISEKMYNKLMAFFKPRQDWKLVETTNLKLSVQACDDARINKRMIGIFGKTGYGKSTALEYVSRNQPQTFYLEAKSLWNRKHFLMKLQQAMGIKLDGDLTERMESITQKLIYLDNPLIIIDDAGKLKDPVFNLLQIIFDDTEGHAGIVVAGTPEFERDFRRKVARNKSQWPELYRRIGYWQLLEAPSQLAVQAVCQHNGIADKACMKYLYEHTDNYGTLKEWIRNAHILATRFEQGIDINLLKQVKVS